MNIKDFEKVLDSKLDIKLTEQRQEFERTLDKRFDEQTNKFEQFVDTKLTEQRKEYERHMGAALEHVQSENKMSFEVLNGRIDGLQEMVVQNTEDIADIRMNLGRLYVK